MFPMQTPSSVYYVNFMNVRCYVSLPPLSTHQNEAFENAKISKMWHAFLAALYPTVKYFATIKVEKDLKYVIRNDGGQRKQDYAQ